MFFYNNNNNSGVLYRVFLQRSHLAPFYSRAPLSIRVLSAINSADGPFFQHITYTAIMCWRSSLHPPLRYFTGRNFPCL